MDTTLIVVLVVVALLIVGAAAAMVFMNRQKGEKLRERFGPEYERTVSSTGRREGEKDLEERTKRVEKYSIRELDGDERRRFSEEWRSVQARFVDEPGEALIEADNLVQRVMHARGYPVSDFEQQAADISVDHPLVVENYRAAHATAEAHRREGVSTEDLRQAMIHYRALFSELLGEVGAER